MMGVLCGLFGLGMMGCVRVGREGGEGSGEGRLSKVGRVDGVGSGVMEGTRMHE